MKPKYPPTFERKTLKRPSGFGRALERETATCESSMSGLGSRSQLRPTELTQGTRLTAGIQTHNEQSCSGRLSLPLFGRLLEQSLINSLQGSIDRIAVRKSISKIGIDQYEVGSRRLAPVVLAANPHRKDLRSYSLRKSFGVSLLDSLRCTPKVTQPDY